jgi:hypothetical protein
VKRGSLSEYFRGVAAKILSAVEADTGVSRQHELNGVAALKAILGSDKRTIPARFVRLADAEDSTASASGSLTWYDARENDPKRAAEYRLYFTTTPVSDLMQPGDLFVIGLRPDGSALCLTAEAGSTAANQLLWLFGIPRDGLKGFAVVDEEDADELELDYAARFILDEIGIEPEADPDLDALLESVLRRFGPNFPSTKAFSEFAREKAQLDPRDGPDEVLMAWMDVEEAAFRALERLLISERLKNGFGDATAVDVDGFIAFSLGVQNRRKSRAGHALENHLEAVFQAHGIAYSRAAVTENKNKPDFLFPGVGEYRNATFPMGKLTMLAAKTSAKDRWRQILGEADRIPDKHLLTLEPGISENQTSEMKARRVTLVLPREIHYSYTQAQRSALMDVESFIDLVAERQRDSSSI